MSMQAIAQSATYEVLDPEYWTVNSAALGSSYCYWFASEPLVEIRVRDKRRNVGVDDMGILRLDDELA